MGNSDKDTAQRMIQNTSTNDAANNQSGVDYTKGRVNTLQPIADQQAAQIYGGYSDLASGKTGVDQAAADRLLGGNYSAIPGASSGGGGGSAPASNAPSYLDTFHQLQTPTGGFDPTRLSNITTDAGALRDTSGNYGQSDTSINGLQNFASTGGLSAAQLASINQPTLTDFAQTGGYTDADKANIRARSNAGIASTYANMQDNLNRQRLTGNNIGPGWSSAGFKLARQGSQDVATNTRGTEADILGAVNQNRLAAAGKLGDLGLGTAGLQSQNTLSGYGTSGALANAKQAQIDAAKEASAGIDTNTQALINQSRLSAAGGESSDTLGRMSIGAQSGAAKAALDAANQRFLISEADANRNTGLHGMLDTYQADPTQLMQDQGQLFNYYGQGANQQQGLINSQISTGYMPGATAGFKNIMGGIGSLAGIGSGIMGGFGSGGGSGPMEGNGLPNGGLNSDGSLYSYPTVPNYMPGYPGNPTTSYGGTP